jgi:hypothetical protein
MPEKLLQAAIITFLLNLVVGIRLSSFEPKVSAPSQPDSFQALSPSKLVWQKGTK